MKSCDHTIKKKILRNRNEWKILRINRQHSGFPSIRKTLGTFHNTSLLTIIPYPGNVCLLFETVGYKFN